MASLCLLVLLISNVSHVSAKQEQPEDIIAEEIQAQNLKQWDRLPDHWVVQEQASLREFFSNAEDRAALRGYFNMKSARLVAIKELRAKEAEQFVDLNSYLAQYKIARVFYTAIDYGVTQEDRYHYNGVNYRLMVVVQEDKAWRLAEMSEAPVELLAEMGQGFGTDGEKDATKVRQARTKGNIINAKGQQLGKNVGDVEDERRRRGDNPAPPETSAVAASNPVPPSLIYVRMTKTANKNFYHCSSECTIGMTLLNTYIKNVLPNEWSDQNFPTNALRAGAMAVKHYGWYRVLNCKYCGMGFDVYDDTRDQAYIANTTKTWSDSAIDYVAGLGMMRDRSQDIFQAQHIKGSCICDGGKAGGKVLQLGSWWQATNGGRDYYAILQYYYNGATANLGGQSINFFFY